MDVTGRESTAVIVAELLGEAEIKGKLVGTEVPNGGAVDVCKRDVAQ